MVVIENIYLLKLNCYWKNTIEFDISIYLG